MAIDIKEMFADCFLELLEKQSLSTITIQTLLDQTGAARQTFYNHYQDKNDLICYIYNTKIIHEFQDPMNIHFDFSKELLGSFRQMEKYHCFLEQALRMEEAGCLKDYIFQHSCEFDMKWHQACYGDEKMPEELVFATKYHAIASNFMAISWILSSMPTTCEDMVDMIVQMRSIGMDKLFVGSRAFNPYLK